MLDMSRDSRPDGAFRLPRPNADSFHVECLVPDVALRDDLFATWFTLLAPKAPPLPMGPAWCADSYGELRYQYMLGFF